MKTETFEEWWQHKSKFEEWWQHKSKDIDAWDDSDQKYMKTIAEIAWRKGWAEGFRDYDTIVRGAE